MFHLEYSDKPSIDVPYSLDSNLPVGYALTMPEESSTQVNITVLDEENQNLTASQKLLLEYHYKFGHTNMPLVQQILRSEGFPLCKFAAATKCIPPKCAICEIAKGHRRATKGHQHVPNPMRIGTLRINDLKPGSTISVDHFESRLFSAIETIRAKQNFERYAFNHGVIPLTYLTDSGAFKANKFVQHIREHNQRIQYCGTNAHHQNGTLN